MGLPRLTCSSCFAKPVLSKVEGLSTSRFFLRRGVCLFVLSLAKGERGGQGQVKTALGRKLKMKQSDCHASALIASPAPLQLSYCRCPSNLKKLLFSQRRK
jgi:hypothetical protein